MQRPLVILPAQGPLSGVKRTFKHHHFRQYDRQLMDNTEDVSSFNGSSIEQLAGECPFCRGVLVVADEIGLTARSVLLIRYCPQN